MKAFGIIVKIAAVAVLAICVYIFLRGSPFDGEIGADLLSWYFLAKGIFCSCALWLGLRILETISAWKGGVGQ